MGNRKRSSVKMANRYLSYGKRGIPGLFLSSHDQVSAKKIKKIYRLGCISLLFHTNKDSEEFEKLSILDLANS